MDGLRGSSRRTARRAVAAGAAAGARRRRRVADPALVDALAAYDADPRAPRPDVLDGAGPGARLLVRVVAVLAELQSAERGPDGWCATSRATWRRC